MRHPSWHFVWFALRFSLGCALLSALGAAPAAAQTTKPLVRVQLHWTHQAQFAGYYVAKELGFYQRAGIEVEFAPGGVYVDPMTVLGLGGADVAVGWLSGAISARRAGVDVVNIAQVFKRPAMRLVCRRSSGISDPSDIKGKTIGVWNIGDQYNVIDWLRRQNRSAADVEIVQQAGDAADLLDRTVDCATAMSYNEYVTILNAGIPPSDLLIVSFASDGVSLLEDGLYAQAEALKDASKRDRIARFLKASAEGWRYASQQRDEAITITKLYAPLADSTRQRTMLDTILPLIDLDERFGLLNLGDFERSTEIIGTGVKDLHGIAKAAHHGWTHRIWYAAEPERSRRNLLAAGVQHELRKIVDSTWFYVFVLAGITTYAVWGFMQAHSLRYDLWGAFLLTFLPALGGGIMRDLLVGGERQPLAILTDPAPVTIVLIVVVLGTMVTRLLPPAALQSKAYADTMTLADAFGFATLTVWGANVALVAGLSWFWVPICSAITCAGGGILLTTVTAQRPSTLQGEPYEEVAVAGGLFMLGGLLIANQFEHSPWIVTATIFATLIGVFATRLAAVHYGWRSYRLGLQRKAA